MDWHDAVVRITGLQPAGKPYGTGFVVWQDDNPKQDDKVSLIVTCWHVVTTVGRDHLRIKNKPCQLVSEEGDDALDLAVLSVSGLPDKKPLIVSDQGRQDLVISMPIRLPPTTSPAAAPSWRGGPSCLGRFRHRSARRSVFRFSAPRQTRRSARTDD
jgi:hypothetical protein